jgi:2'-5' RNA ligase
LLRLFLAVWPPSPVLSALGTLDRRPHPDLRWTTPEQWHCTIRFFGRCAPEEVLAAWAPMAAAGPAEAVLGPATAAFGRRVLHVPVTGLDALAASAATATGRVGEPPDPRPFQGHITLARARGRAADLGALVGVPVTGRWPVEAVELVASRLGAGGSRYEVLARLQLT